MYVMCDWTPRNRLDNLQFKKTTSLDCKFENADGSCNASLIMTFRRWFIGYSDPQLIASVS